MATFDDILADAQPAIQYGDQAVEDEATEGRDWLFEPVELYDSAGDPIDLETMGVTAECVVYDRADWSQVIALDVTIDGPTINLTADAADTAGLAGDKRIKFCAWRLTLTHTATSRKVDVWGVRDSSLAIRGAD